MSLRRQRSPDSLEMLLDTMCNTFGGIILLAVLVTLLSRHERSAQTGAVSDSQEMLERRLSLAQTDLEQSLRLAALLHSKAADPQRTNQIALLSFRHDLQGRLEQLREAASASAQSIETTNATRPSERLKVLEAQLTSAEAKKLEKQNSLQAVKDNTERLRERLASLQRQVAVSYSESVKQLPLPKEYETGKRPFWVIVQYGRIYPCRNADLRRNEMAINWTDGGDSETAHPIPGRGYSPDDSARLRQLFNEIPQDRYLAFCVFEDSFPAFITAAELGARAGLACGWDPIPSERGPISFGPLGHKPKPQ